MIPADLLMPQRVTSRVSPTLPYREMSSFYVVNGARRIFSLHYFPFR